MSEVLVAEKAGMLVGGNKEDGYNVIGWVLAGDEYDCDTESGEALVTHHKTAEKLGLGDVFKEMKAENAPKKVVKEPKADGEKVARTRFELTDDMTFDVIRPDFVAASTDDVRGETYRLLFSLKNVGDFLKATKGYAFTGARDGGEKFCTARECIVYAYKRGAITKPAVA